MQKINLVKNNVLVLFLAGMLAAGPALADKPSWAGGGKGDKGEQGDDQGGSQKHGRSKHERSGRDEHEGRRHEYFGDHQRTVIRQYYADEFHGGRCPPGLAKKRNGCMPPGQAKKWRIGRPLPAGVVYYDLPPVVVTQIGPPPAGHRYVRVASDILLMAIGTGMIVDAMEDLSR